MQAVKEMYRQRGDLTINDAGLAEKGLLVRHLVMPEELSGTADIMKFLFTEVSQGTYVNIMPQYRPCGKSYLTEKINRPLTREEYHSALAAARQAGITRLD